MQSRMRLLISFFGSALIFILHPKYVDVSFLGTAAPSWNRMPPAPPKCRYSHFPLFNRRPYLLPSFSISASSLSIASSSWVMHMVSSAYRISSSFIPVTRWCCKLSLSCSCTSWNRQFMTIRKRYGDSGHPYFIPVSWGVHSASISSIETRKLGWRYSSLIASVVLLGTFMRVSASISLSCLTLSNAFSQSNNTSKVFVSVFSPFFYDSSNVVDCVCCALVCSKPVLCRLKILV